MISLKNKLQGICFSTLNSYNFDKVNTNLTEPECKPFFQKKEKKKKNQKVDKGNTTVITSCENYLKGMNCLLSDNSITQY